MDDMERYFEINVAVEGIAALSKLLNVDETTLITSLKDGLETNDVDMENDDVINTFEEFEIVFN